MRTAAEKYSQLTTEREQYLSRAEECANLTIPSVFYKRTDDSQYPDIGEQVCPVNSVGARGLRNVSSKLMMTLLPPNQPFFKYEVSDDILSELPEGITRGDIDLVLSQAARAVEQYLSKSNLRKEASEMFPNLVCAGNPLIFVRPDLNFEFYNLNNFVIERDRMGTILTIVVKETFKSESIPEEIKDLIPEEKKDKDKNIDIYTHVHLNDESRYESFQEVCGVAIEESKTVYPKGINPWIAPRIFKISGEHYGRSYIEEFLGDLRSLEGLSKSLLDMAAASSRALVLVSPTAITDLSDLNNAPNGSFVPGNPNDFNPLSVKLSGDFSVVRSQAVDIEQRLAQAMLLISSIQRDAERVTAEEIRAMSSELDSALSGAFSVLAEEFQKPLIQVFQWRMQKAGIFKLPKDLEIAVLTGVDAIGKGQDLGKLNNFVNTLISLSQAGVNLMPNINSEELLTRIAAGSGIDEKGLIKSQEQVNQEQQQAMAMEALNNGQLGKTLGKIAEDQNDPSKQPQEQTQ